MPESQTAAAEIAKRIRKRSGEDRGAGSALIIVGFLWTLGTCWLLWSVFVFLLAEFGILENLSAISLAAAVGLIGLMYALRPRERSSLDTQYDLRRIAYTVRHGPTLGAKPSLSLGGRRRSSFIGGMLTNTARNYHRQRSGSYFIFLASITEVVGGGIRMIVEGFGQLRTGRRRRQDWITENAVRVYEHLAAAGDAGLPEERFDDWIGDDPHKLGGIVALDDIGLLGKRTTSDPPVMLARSLDPTVTEWDNP